MRSSVILATSVFACALTTDVFAQTDIGKNHDGGLPWSVAAPGGAAWALTCRFTPVTVQWDQYDRHAWANRLERTGAGRMRGRLPGDNGRCVLTKTGGTGPVGLALLKNGVATSDGTNDPARPARVNVF